MMRLMLTSALVVGAVLFHAAPSAAAEGPPFPRIANCYAVGLRPDSTPADIEEIARFDLLIGGVWCNWADAAQREKLAANVAAVRKRNPHILIIEFSSSAPYHYPTDKSFPATGWLLQPDGKRVLGWPGTEMINLTRPEVLDFLAGRSVASVRDRGFDGSFIDCMGGGFDWWACNIESGGAYKIDANADGKPDERAWLDGEWVRAKTELSRKVRDGLGPKPVYMTNQAGEWGMPTMNGILLEDYLDYVIDGRMGWDRVMHDYLAWTRAPHRPNVTTIVSSSGIEPPYEAWKRLRPEEQEPLLERGRGLTQRMRFGLATTLMGDGYFAYDLHTRWRGQRWWYPEYDAPLGYPKGPGAAQPDGTWRREFDGGSVVVNPTHLDVPVRFDGRRRDASSGKVGQAFLVPALDGRIYLPTDAPEAAGSLPEPSPALTLAGPEPIVARGDRVLCRLGGLPPWPPNVGGNGGQAAALFDERGCLLSITDGARALLQGARPLVVRDDHWRDFGYEECRREVLAGGKLRFTGRRVDGEMSVAYVQEVWVAPGELTLTYRWEAFSDAHFHMFRQQVDLPAAVYGGGRYQAGEAQGALPAERAPEPHIARVEKSVEARTADGRRVTLSFSQPADLVDERHYGADGFRLGLHPAPRDVKKGDRWEYTVRIRVGAEGAT